MDPILLFIERVLPVLWQGTIITLQLASVSLLLGMALGLPLGVLRVYGPAPVQRIVAFYVLIFQGTPLLGQLFIIYYGLPATHCWPACSTACCQLLTKTTWSRSTRSALAITTRFRR